MSMLLVLFIFIFSIIYFYIIYKKGLTKFKRKAILITDFFEERTQWIREAT